MRGAPALLIALLTTDAVGASAEQVRARLEGVEPLRTSRAIADAPAPSESELGRVLNGEIVTGVVAQAGSAASKVYGAAILDASIALLWAALNDETRQPGYTAITYSELVAGRPCEDGRKVFQYLPVPMVADRWWIGLPRPNHALIRESGGSVRELSWTSSTDPALVTSPAAQAMLARASPIGSSRGAWFLVALDTRSTWVEYFAVSDPGGRIPASITGRLAAAGVRDNFTAILRFAKEGNPTCPIR